MPFPIACGQCYVCTHDLWSCCDNSNPNAAIAETLYGFAPSGLFGYSRMDNGVHGDGSGDHAAPGDPPLPQGWDAVDPGVYGGFIDKVPMGAAFNKGLTLKMGQTHVHKYLPGLLRLIEDGRIDPSFTVTHTVRRSRMRRNCTRRSATRKTAASRLS